MATRIRLTRRGRKSNPIYRVVVADSRAPRDGKFLEQVGYFDPNSTPNVITFEADRVIDWLEKGAQPSERVLSLLKLAGVYAKFVAKKDGQDVANFVITPKAPRTRKRKPGPKAVKRAAAAAAAAETAE